METQTTENKELLIEAVKARMETLKVETEKEDEKDLDKIFKKKNPRKALKRWVKK